MLGFIVPHTGEASDEGCPSKTECLEKFNRHVSGQGILHLNENKRK
jgi:hypothetical protein